MQNEELFSRIASQPTHMYASFVTSVITGNLWNTAADRSEHHRPYKMIVL